MALFFMLLTTKGTGSAKQHGLDVHLATSASFRGNPKLEAKPQGSVPKSSFVAVWVCFLSPLFLD